MNERVRKYFVSAMALCCALLLVFPFCVRNVHAEDSTIEEDITYIVNQPYRFSSIKYTNSNINYYVRVRLGTSNTNSFVTPDSMVDPQTLYGITYITSDNYKYLLLFSETKFSLSGSDQLNVRVDNSVDRLNWQTWTNYYVSNTYTAQVNNNGVVSNGKTLYYNNQMIPDNYITDPTQYINGCLYMMENIPRVKLNAGQDYKSILYLFSADDFSYVPWNFSTSSGGMHFADGSELSPSDTSEYNQIYIVMDSNHDNSVSEAEIYYYNSTYNTNYDYDEINNGNDFDVTTFLNWVALQIQDGIENPGGGSGEGGGSGGIDGGSGIYIGDGSFTQSQNQTIEENAVNVTVNNNNSLSQENVQTLENFIELNLGQQQENAFAEAVGGISRFIGVGQAFAGLVTAVLGFLPAWTITLLGVLFTIIFVMIVFRLLHVFL